MAPVQPKATRNLRLRPAALSAPPASANPPIIIAQLAGSGTAAPRSMTETSSTSNQSGLLKTLKTRSLWLPETVTVKL